MKIMVMDNYKLHNWQNKTLISEDELPYPVQ